MRGRGAAAAVAAIAARGRSRPRSVRTYYNSQGTMIMERTVSIKNHEAALSAKLETSVSDLKSHAELELSMSRNEIVEKLSHQATAVSYVYVRTSCNM